VAAVHDLTIDPETWRGILHSAQQAADLPPGHIRDEYDLILLSPHPAAGLTLLRDSGILTAATPELLPLTAMPDHGPRHPLSLWDHTMRVLECVQPELVARWAAVLHDIAKPATRTHEPSGRPRFFHHEEVGADMVERFLRRLRYPDEVVSNVASLIGSHMQFHAYSPEWSDAAVRRLMLRMGPLLDAAIDLARADAAGHSLGGCVRDAPKFDDLERRIAAFGREPLEVPESPLDGNDLMSRYGLPPGPWIRRIKDALKGEVEHGHLAPDDREAAWRLADELVDLPGEKLRVQ
jgi:poly(A) polymerase